MTNTSLFERLRREHSRRHAGDTTKGDTVTVGGETMKIGDSETAQSREETFLTSSKYGARRGREALEAREIGQTQAMEIIKNTIVDQLTGGELAFESDDEDVDQAESELRTLFRDVLNGPHLMGDDLDDLIAAGVSDMVDVGNAYWEALPSADGALPVASLKPVDALTVRHNVTETGAPKDPPYYQAPFQTTAGSAIGIGEVDPAALDQDDLVVMRYPGSRRSYKIYPRAPALQVRDALELLANSTTHHNRFYNDDELPPGLLQVMQANQQTVDTIKSKLEEAANDPRAAPVIGGEGPAKWIEVGGTAINLDVIEEQKWFLQLCLACFGLGKSELGLIEDVNRSNGEEQSSIVFKRVTRPFAKTFGQAITRQLLPQFDLYRDLDEPFEATLQFSDPERERQRQDHVVSLYQQGVLTYNEAKSQLGDEPDNTTVEIDGQTVDYGDHPLFVAQALLKDVTGSDEADPPDAEPSDDGGNAQ